MAVDHQQRPSPTRTLRTLLFTPFQHSDLAVLVAAVTRPILIMMTMSCRPPPAPRRPSLRCRPLPLALGVEAARLAPPISSAAPLPSPHPRMRDFLRCHCQRRRRTPSHRLAAPVALAAEVVWDSTIAAAPRPTLSAVRHRTHLLGAEARRFPKRIPPPQMSKRDGALHSTFCPHPRPTKPLTTMRTTAT